MKNYLVILTTLCLMAFASCSSEEGAVYMLRPHEELPEEVEADRSFTKVFLAGTIDMGNSRDWQAELFEEFQRAEEAGIFCSTRDRSTGIRPARERWTIRSAGNCRISKRLTL